MKFTRYATCLMAVMFMSACASYTPVREKTSYYVLEYPPPITKSLDTLDVAVKVSRFNIAALYNSLPMVYRADAFERNTYAYHLWREPPTDMVRDLLIRDLRASGAFRLVLRSDTDAEARFRLEGDIEEFYELDQKETWSAVFTAVMTLLDEEAQDVTRLVLFQRSYTEQQICAEKRPKAVVLAMSQAVQAFSAAFIPELHAAVKRRLAEDSSDRHVSKVPGNPR
ncbi:MAG: membrane integrity-associated transporter subunit PqiC [Deltaproteobacteria bacterium]|nr:membrane integrity-associated transporter subunit PqiC [Deltaproteobacteria bacterium]